MKHLFLIVLGIFLGAIMAGQLGYTADSKIRSGKSFIVDRETYTCQKTNELKEGQ